MTIEFRIREHPRYILTSCEVPPSGIIAKVDYIAEFPTLPVALNMANALALADSEHDDVAVRINPDPRDRLLAWVYKRTKKDHPELASACSSLVDDIDRLAEQLNKNPILALDYRNDKGGYFEKYRDQA